MIVDKACRVGIRVMFVDPKYTSQTCSACGAIGKRKSTGSNATVVTVRTATSMQVEICRVWVTGW